MRVTNSYEFAKLYENNQSLKDRKKKGIYYTPQVIVQLILKQVLKDHDIIKNPEPKIIDLSCGCGNFLIEAFDILYNMIEENLDIIREKYGKNYILNVKEHIIRKCLYGVDIDSDAINILKNNLINNKLKNECKTKDLIEISNISCEDALKKNYFIKFDYIVGNPPYVGHKMLDKEYKKFLLKEYKDVYRDKADLYFCFYKKALDLLNDNGKIGFITPRYFLESPSAKSLRKYLLNNCNILKIIDLNNINVFKDIGVSTLICVLEKKTSNNIISVYKILDNVKVKEMKNLNDLLKIKHFEKIDVEQDDLKENWIILNDEDKIFYDKINKRAKYALEDIAISFQGIITGCDKAFILNIDDERISHINKKLLKPWIKNKHISQYIIEENNQQLIYSNDIKDIDEYEYIKENCFSIYIDRLKNRRECINKIRKWYELQWGREKSLFEQRKIMYPYKSSSNKFAIDEKQSFCSADVYCFYIKEEFKNIFSYEYIVGILNSKIYDKYFKMIGKCMGNKIYDYYPNKVMKLKIFKDKNYNQIESFSKDIISLKKQIKSYYKDMNMQGKKDIFNKEIYYLENETHFLQNKISELINESLEL